MSSQGIIIPRITMPNWTPREPGAFSEKEMWADLNKILDVVEDPKSLRHYSVYDSFTVTLQSTTNRLVEHFKSSEICHIA